MHRSALMKNQMYWMKKQMLEFADEHLYRLLNEMTAATLLACCSLRDRTNLLLELTVLGEVCFFS